MNVISLLLKICLSWEPPPGALSIHPTRPRVKNSCFIWYRSEGQQGGPFPAPPPQLCWPGAPLVLLTPGCWALRLCGWEQETKNNTGGFLATSYYKGCWSQYMCEHRHTGTHTGTHAHWACTQGHAFTYSYPRLGPLRAKGTESLVLGTQLLLVLGWTMPPGPRERREWGDIAKGSQRWGLS